jgi:hypothetical protein
MIAMVQGMNVWNIDQCAVRNNRPDIIVKRLGLNEKALGEDYHVPMVMVKKAARDDK